uniref:Secreted protein n=1 Tax=Oryza sativa subsp. indica TaxID=39946 RepID=A0A679BCM3_ORYSI|nr:hypothetical protein [Oryza sativa Indica Group]BBD82525.1 hypothetical protein [Oryza sativa Indica Group]
MGEMGHPWLSKLLIGGALMRLPRLAYAEWRSASATLRMRPALLVSRAMTSTAATDANCARHAVSSAAATTGESTHAHNLRSHDDRRLGACPPPVSRRRPVTDGLHSHYGRRINERRDNWRLDACPPRYRQCW